MTEKEFIGRMEAVICESIVLGEDLKQIKSEAKDRGYNATKLAKIAKLRAEAKIGDFVQDAKEIINFIEANDL